MSLSGLARHLLLLNPSPCGMAQQQGMAALLHQEVHVDFRLYESST